MTVTAKKKIVHVIIIFLSLAITPKLWAQIHVIDDNQQHIILSQHAQRIVSLAPSITEMLFSAGAGKQIVGVVSYSDFPAQAKKIPSIGSYDSVDLEKIISLNPDLIIAWKSGNQKKQINKLKLLGYPVFISEPKRFTDVANNINKYGILSGHQQQSHQQSLHFLKSINKLKQQFQHKSTISVFVQIWNKPVMTVGTDHLISQVIRLCGGRNIFDSSDITITPDIESVILRKPELILSTGMANIADQWLERWKSMSIIPAVKNNHLYSTIPDLLVRHSPRLLQGAENVCQLLDKAR
jgi:iron complex transport system substrate-binding protein